LCLDLESKLVMGKVLLGTLSGILYGIVIDQNVILASTLNLARS
jgi:hypothetical protein